MRTITLYHGTSSVNLSCILTIGLAPGHAKGGDAWAADHHWRVAASSSRREPSVYLSDNISHAEDFARLAVEEMGGDPIVVMLHVPVPVFDTFVVDELSVPPGERPHEWRAHSVDASCVGEVKHVPRDHGRNLQSRATLADLLEAISR